MTARIAKINVFRAAGEWHCAWWVDGEYDGSDELDSSTEDEAMATARAMPLRGVTHREVLRVADV